MGWGRKGKAQENIAGLESLGPDHQMDMLGKKEGKCVDEAVVSHQWRG